MKISKEEKTRRKDIKKKYLKRYIGRLDDTDTTIREFCYFQSAIQIAYIGPIKGIVQRKNGKFEMPSLATMLNSGDRLFMKAWCKNKQEKARKRLPHWPQSKD